ncbi:MAG: CPBP family intramembrane metalloprotease, partial [Planctomycetes bacterium]|nr:CPBP family intramembrane metalloprotease [Planctomycetota bacterium]
AAILLGGSSWAIAQQFIALQTRIVPASEAMTQAFKLIETQLVSAPLWQVLLLLAIVPAVAEELFFRGFVLSGLSQGLSKWPAILTAALTFGIYHFILDRVPVTALLGICLAWLCWQSRSILPCVLFHALHNGLLMGLDRLSPGTLRWLGVSDGVGGFLPAGVFGAALLLFLAGLAIVGSMRRRAA